MTTYKKTCSLVMVFTALFLLTATAQAGDNSLTGSWEAVAGSSRALVTFNMDGTFVASADTTSFSTAHGVWEKTGSRSFALKNRAYGYDATGALELVLDSVSTVELSADGQSFEQVVDVTISLPDGTVIGTVSSAASATRISLS